MPFASEWMAHAFTLGALAGLPAVRDVHSHSRTSVTPVCSFISYTPLHVPVPLAGKSRSSSEQPKSLGGATALFSLASSHAPSCRSAAARPFFLTKSSVRTMRTRRHAPPAALRSRRRPACPLLSPCRLLLGNSRALRLARKPPESTALCRSRPVRRRRRTALRPLAALVRVLAAPTCRESPPVYIHTCPCPLPRRTFDKPMSYQWTLRALL